MECAGIRFDSASSVNIIQVAASDLVSIIVRNPSITNTSQKPILTVDGFLAEMSSLKEMDPSDIESINILKYIASSFSCRPSQTVIIITTRSAPVTMLVKDATDGSVIAGATVSFQPVKNEKGDITMPADETGTAKLVLKEKAYEATISSVGYTTQRFSWCRDSSNDKTMTVWLQRKYREQDGVVIKAFCSPRTIACGGGQVTKLTPLAPYPEDTVVSTIFPNPLPRGQMATIRINAAKDELMQVRLFTFTGQLLLSFPAEVKQGSNRFTIPAENKLSLGMYMVQVLDHKGKPIQTDKLIIQ